MMKMNQALVIYKVLYISFHRSVSGIHTHQCHQMRCLKTCFQIMKYCRHGISRLPYSTCMSTGP